MKPNDNENKKRYYTDSRFLSKKTEEKREREKGRVGGKEGGSEREREGGRKKGEKKRKRAFEGETIRFRNLKRQV